MYKVSGASETEGCVAMSVVAEADEVVAWGPVSGGVAGDWAAAMPQNVSAGMNHEKRMLESLLISLYRIPIG